MNNKLSEAAGQIIRQCLNVDAYDPKARSYTDYWNDPGLDTWETLNLYPSNNNKDKSIISSYERVVDKGSPSYRDDYRKDHKYPDYIITPMLKAAGLTAASDAKFDGDSGWIKADIQGSLQEVAETVAKQTQQLILDKAGKVGVKKTEKALKYLQKSCEKGNISLPAIEVPLEAKKGGAAISEDTGFVSKHGNRETESVGTYHYPK